MRLLAIATLLAAVALGGIALAQDGKGQLKISWHGQSFFTLTTGKGTRVVFDPHAITEYGRIQGVTADIVLMSHSHTDHTQFGVIENFRDKDIRIIPGFKGSGKNADWNHVDETIKDVQIRSVPLYHDNMEGMRYGKNTAFILQVDGWTICHLGDLGHLLTPAQIRKIGQVDVLMIPVGGIYTINGGEAKQVVEQLKPKEYIFPMHCGTKIYDKLLTADEFLEDQDKDKVAVSDDNSLILNRDAKRPRPLIVQLNYWPKAK
jgi:L-ascorbate metabolism protein UlaG (beta-lactamase superfamily)